MDLEEQEDELLALDSIFGSEEFVRDESKSAGEIRVSVELPAAFMVLLKEGKYVSLTKKKKKKVSHFLYEIVGSVF